MDEKLSGADRFAALVHEYAHELLHQGGKRESLPDRKTREIEAETVAYVVCRHFGIEASSPAYLALQGADEKEVQARLGRVVSAMKEIISHFKQGRHPMPLFEN